MSLALVHAYTVDIGSGIPLIRLPYDLIGGDANAHQFILTVKKDGVDYDLSGATAVLYAVSSNRHTTLNPATCSGNVITGSLLEESCAVLGSIHILVRVTQGRIKRTIADITSRVREGNTGELIDPGEVITGIDDLLALVYALETATADAAGVITEITASAESVSASTPASAEVQFDEVDGHINIHISVPAGADGVPGVSFTIGTVTTGAPGTSASVVNVGTASDPILNITIPQGPVGAVSSVDGVGDTDGNVVLGALRYNAAQPELTDEDKALVRANAGASAVSRYTVSLPAADWVGSAAPYTQTVTVAGLLDSDVPQMDAVLSATLETRIAQREAYAMISMIEAGTDTLTVTCDEDKPTIDLTVQLEVTK